MELKDYLTLARRWAWLLILGFALGAMAGAIFSLFQSPVYQASTRILVLRAPQEKTTDYTYLSDQQLVQTYIQLLSTRPVIEGASVKLGLEVDPKQVSVQQIRDTQAIQLTVVDENPQRAADIANILIQVLIEQNEIIQAGRYTLTEQSIQAQIQQIDEQIARLESEMGGASADPQQQQQMQVYQQIYISLLNNLEQIRLARLQNTPNVVQIESATIPESPVRPRPVINTGLGAIVGLLLAGGVAFLIDYIDDTIRTPEDIERILKLPVVGYIGDMRNAHNEIDDIHVVHNPRSPVAEAFRSLRTNLEFTNVDSSLAKILITSPGPGEGKTTVSINLAAIIAQGGKRVLLIDADLRRPRVHSIFGISNRIGLTTLFRGQLPLKSVMRRLNESTELYVITSGGLPPNPTELLASARMDQILQEASGEFDVIILDSPPSLVADFQVLSTKVDGTFLVIQPGYTHADIALAALEQLNRVNARPLGVVLNKIPKDSHNYGGYYHYHPYKSGYYDQEAGDPQLAENNQPVNLLPGSQLEEVYVRSGEALQQIYDSEQPQDYISVPVPPKDVPASHNEITQPRKNMDAAQVISREVAEKRPPGMVEFHTWYLGQDDEQNIDEK